MSVANRANGVAVEQRVVGKPLGLGRHANEFFVVAVLTQARRLTRSRERPTIDSR
jgi:hypothetical protein